MLAAVQVGHPAALVATDDGRVLLAKLALIAALLGLAGWNRFRLTGREDRAALRRCIAAEVALSLLVIATLALWRFTPPPRGLLPPSEAVVTLAPGDLRARLVVSPARVGPVTARVEDLRLAGEALAPRSMVPQFAKPAYGLGPFAREVGAGPAGFLLPLNGIWVVRLRVTIGDFRAEELRDLVEIAPSG